MAGSSLAKGTRLAANGLAYNFPETSEYLWRFERLNIVEIRLFLRPHGIAWQILEALAARFMTGMCPPGAGMVEAAACQSVIRPT